MEAEALREVFQAVKPERYMHKAHWNTVSFDGSIPGAAMREMLYASHALVVAGLGRLDREAILSLDGGKK